MGKIPNLKAVRDWVLSKTLTLTNNLLATEAGISAMDAAQGPVIQGQIDEINSNLSRIPFPDYSGVVELVSEELKSGIFSYNASCAGILYLNIQQNVRTPIDLYVNNVKIGQIAFSGAANGTPFYIPFSIFLGSGDIVKTGNLSSSCVVFKAVFVSIKLS